MRQVATSYNLNPPLTLIFYSLDIACYVGFFFENVENIHYSFTYKLKIYDVFWCYPFCMANRAKDGVKSFPQNGFRGRSGYWKNLLSLYIKIKKLFLK